jgi:PAP2 superfamily protein
MSVVEARTMPERRHRVHWWKEALIVVAFYLLYSWTRNLFGSNALEPGELPTTAFGNAERVIRLERVVGLYHEVSIQELFLPYRWFIQFWNTYYGIAHFVVTVGAFIWMFRCGRHSFPRWRNALALTTALAIVGFSLFPLMPPRLLNNDGIYGGDRVATEQGRENFGYVDTLDEYGGPWSFDSGTMQRVSNQYAAMPSLHIGWATWSAIALWPLLHRWWLRAAVLAYPMVTLLVIIVTANHYWIDAVGGLVIFAVGAIVGWGFHRWNQDRLDRNWTHRYAGVTPPTVAARPQ